MRKLLLPAFLLFALVSYILPTQLVEGEVTSPPKPEAAILFPLESNPIDRSNQERIVSFSDALGTVTPAVVGVYPSRIVTVADERTRLHPLEEMLRRYYGLPMPGESNGEGEGRKLPQGMGSGVLISAEGYILTNHHVITDEQGNKADEVLVQLSDKRELVATIVGSDEKTDVAVLKIKADKLPHLPMADSENLKVGDIVFAIGNPFSVGLTVTMGIVSATGRSDLGILGRQGYENFIQTDAPINPGNSGGALVDAEGRLVGINSAIISRTGGNIGIGFAIPITLAHSIILDLIETGTVQRGFLGVAITNLDPDMAEAFGLDDTRGALVQNVEEGLPADGAGIQPGDVIVKVDDKPIDSMADLRLTIASMPPGTTVYVTVIREGKKHDFEVTLSNLKDPYSPPAHNRGSKNILAGVTLHELTLSLREDFKIDDNINGLLVAEVGLLSPHANSLREGMVIVEINDTPVKDFASAKSSIKGGVNKLWIYDQGTYGFVAIRVK